MDRAEVPDELWSRLKSNLAAAGIRISDSDLEGMVQRGFLLVPMAFEALLQRVTTTPIPDYLHAWGYEDPTDISAPPRSLREIPRHRAGSLEETARKLRSQELSPVELTQQTLMKIAERDPVLNAFQLVCENEARSASGKAEQEIASGHYRGPLHGIPVVVKDLLAMRGTITTAGSRILADRVTDYDAAVVEKLRDAGAIIVAKTRMSEFAYSPGSNNAHYGPTRNPVRLDADTGGSSSGSGAAVADGIVCAALGTDTGGSIRIPSSQCGIVGVKPTYGRVSLYGADSLSWSLDHVGPMTRTVRDAALMLQALAGHDQRDPRTRNVPLIGLDQLEAGVQGLRIGVLGNDGASKRIATDEALKAWHSALRKLESRGAELVTLDIPDFDGLRTLNSSIIAMEAASLHQPMLRERLGDFGEFMRQRVLAAFAFGPLSFVRAQQARAILRERVSKIFDRVDMLSTPTMPAGAPPLGVPASTAYTGPFNLLGWPAISVPCGLTPDGLPLGLQLAGRPWDEAAILRAARAMEE